MLTRVLSTISMPQVEAELVDYTVNSVTEGIDAMATTRVAIRPPAGTVASEGPSVGKVPSLRTFQGGYWQRQGEEWVGLGGEGSEREEPGGPGGKRGTASYAGAGVSARKSEQGNNGTQCRMLAMCVYRQVGRGLGQPAPASQGPQCSTPPHPGLVANAC